MDVVNYSEAARRAGVSRAMITKLKNSHIKKESIKTYFGFDPKTGKEGIDVDDNNWIKYVNKNNKQRSNQKKQSVTTRCKPTDGEQPETVNKNDFAMAVVRSIQATGKFDDKELKSLLKDIEVRYEGIV